MRYHFEKPDIYIRLFGEDVPSSHPLYNECTLFKIKNKGIAVVQRRFNPVNKTFYYSKIDPWLCNDIFTNKKFPSFFNENAKEAANDIYPTFELRKLMWALRMKPLKKEYWESEF